MRIIEIKFEKGYPPKLVDRHPISPELNCCLYFYVIAESPQNMVHWRCSLHRSEVCKKDWENAYYHGYSSVQCSGILGLP